MGVQHFQTKAINHRLVAEGKGWEREEPPQPLCSPRKAGPAPELLSPFLQDQVPPVPSVPSHSLYSPLSPPVPLYSPLSPPLFPPVPSVPRDMGLQLPGPSTADLQRPRCFLPVWSSELLQPWGELSTHMFPHVA